MGLWTVLITVTCQGSDSSEYLSVCGGCNHLEADMESVRSIGSARSMESDMYTPYTFSTPNYSDTTNTTYISTTSSEDLEDTLSFYAKKGIKTLYFYALLNTREGGLRESLRDRMSNTREDLKGGLSVTRNTKDKKSSRSTVSSNSLLSPSLLSTASPSYSFLKYKLVLLETAVLFLKNQETIKNHLISLLEGSCRHPPPQLMLFSFYFSKFVSSVENNLLNFKELEKSLLDTIFLINSLINLLRDRGE